MNHWQSVFAYESYGLSTNAIGTFQIRTVKSTLQPTSSTGTPAIPGSTNMSAPPASASAGVGAESQVSEGREGVREKDRPAPLGLGTTGLGIAGA